MYTTLYHLKDIVRLSDFFGNSGLSVFSNVYVLMGSTRASFKAKMTSTFVQGRMMCNSDTILFERMFQTK